MEMAFKEKFIENRRVLMYETCDSTNIRLKEIANDTGDETVVITQMQTRGRGRKDRTWLSRSQMGAWFSILVKPDKDIPAVCASGLVFVAALSVASVLREKTGRNVLVKWPNDIVLSGKKICGIMCEMRTRDVYLDYAVLGIGVNLLGIEFPSDLPHASSIEKETGIQIPPLEFLRMFIKRFSCDRRIWEEHGVKEILKRIEKVSATLHSKVRAVSDTEAIEGEAVSFTDDGSLVIKTEDGLKTFIAGDVSVRGIMGYV